MGFPKAGDLEGMIMDVLSIDEYESKLGKEQQVIVVAFEVKSEDAGKDVRDFVQRGTAELIDAEVSPAPNEELNWMVFVEFKRDFKFWEKLDQVIEEVERLHGSKIDWRVYTYFTDRVYTLGSSSLRNDIPTTPADYVIRKYKKKKGELGENITEFFKDSLAESINYDGENIVIQNRIKRMYFTPEALDTTSKILESGIEDAVNILDISLDEEMLRRMLGETYILNSTRSKIYIQHREQDRILVLKKHG